MFKRFFLNNKTGNYNFLRIGVATVFTIGAATFIYDNIKTQLLESSKTELSQNHFVKYKISWRKFIDDDHFLLEVTPKKPQMINLWKQNGYKKLWSVQIKQPNIHVVRNYTPLPLAHDVNSGDDIKLKVYDDDDEIHNGKMMFYIKRYSNGEVARWLSKLPEGHELEIRGPYIDFEFPEAPDDEIVLDRSFLNSDEDIEEKTTIKRTKYNHFDINFFAGGTGIVTPLQLLLTQDPFKGKMQIIYAGKNGMKEISPLLPFINKLEQQKRIKIIPFDDFRNECKDFKKLNNLIKEPYPLGSLEYVKKTDSRDESIKPVFSLVVGPEGFIDAVSGPKYENHQGPITGLLGAKNWDNNTVFKLS